MSTRQITRCGLSVALLAVAASVTIPFGPVPFTLQTLVLALLPVAVGGRQAVRAVAIYLLLGALGLPVFSGFSGGLAHVVGPTGGFLWGFLVGTVLASAVLGLRAIPERVREVASGFAMLVASYLFGTLQLVFLLNLSPTAAIAVAVAPFVLPDVVKVLAGVTCGRTVRRALGTAADERAAA